MSEYPTLEEFLEAIEESKMSVPVPLPLQMVADHLDITRAGVDKMLMDERLRSVTLAGTRFVEAQSLIQKQAKEAQDISKVRTLLEEKARAGMRHVFYEPLMTAIHRSPKVPADRSYIGRVLGAISADTYKEYGLFLTVLVHRKTAGTTKPGPGFQGLFDMVGRPWKSKTEQDFIESETDRVLAHYSRKRPRN